MKTLTSCRLALGFLCALAVVSTTACSHKHLEAPKERPASQPAAQVPGANPARPDLTESREPYAVDEAVPSNKQ